MRNGHSSPVPAQEMQSPNAREGDIPCNRDFAPEGRYTLHLSHRSTYTDQYRRNHRKMPLRAHFLVSKGLAQRDIEDESTPAFTTLGCE